MLRGVIPSRSFKDGHGALVTGAMWQLRASGSGASKATLEADAYACGVLISKMLELCGLTGAPEASSCLVRRLLHST
eukprot:50289-Eustigmatos_ZCMA.PRE.1